MPRAATPDRLTGARLLSEGKVERPLMLVTALAPIIGHDRAAAARLTLRATLELRGWMLLSAAAK